MIKSESNVIVFCLTILPLVHFIYKQLPRRAITSVSNVVILSFRYDAVFCVNKSVTFWFFLFVILDSVSTSFGIKSLGIDLKIFGLRTLGLVTHWC